MVAAILISCAFTGLRGVPLDCITLSHPVVLRRWRVPQQGVYSAHAAGIPFAGPAGVADQFAGQNEPPRETESQRQRSCAGRGRAHLATNWQQHWPCHPNATTMHHRYVHDVFRLETRTFYVTPTCSQCHAHARRADSNPVPRGCGFKSHLRYWNEQARRRCRGLQMFGATSSATLSPCHLPVWTSCVDALFDSCRIILLQR